MSNPGGADTAEFTGPPGVPGRRRPRPSSSLVEVDLAGLSHQGKVRPRNEDHFLTARFGRALETLQTNLPAGELPGRFEEAGYAALVADGMGGAAGGEAASRLAIATLVDLVLATPDWILRLDEGRAEEVLRRARERAGQLRSALRGEALADPALGGSGTTLTLAWSLGAALFVLHAGDSRAYLCRGGRLSRLTRDHTVAQELADRGLIGQEQVAAHPMRHFLTQAFGAGCARVVPEVRQWALQDGDCLLLCTDGLTNMVAEPAIAAALAAGGSAEQTCRGLIDQALEAGGRDNVTAVVARYRIPAEP